MKALLLAAFILITLSGALAQDDTNHLKIEVQNLDVALLKKDTVALMKLLDAQVTFGHSNGWVQTRSDVIKDLASAYIVYEKIESSNLKFAGDADWASVRMNVAVKGKVNSKAFDMQLHVLEVWKKIKRHWLLIARQSAKI